MAGIFEDFDLAGFWEPLEPDADGYVGPPVTDEAVAAVESELGYKLPASYVELMQYQNGGVPWRTCRRLQEDPDEHVDICGLYSIGGEAPNSLLGKFGSQFWMDEWGYPAIGIYFADCPSAGHDMLFLDYRACGPTGEPQVVYVNEENDYQIQVVAESFEAFVRGLEEFTAFEDEDADEDDDF